MKVEVWKGHVSGKWVWACLGCCDGGWGVTHPIALWLALEHIRRVHQKQPPERTTS